MSKKITFGLSGRNKPTPAKIKKLSTAVAAFLATIATMSLLQDHEILAFVLMAFAGFLREIIVPLFGEVDEEEKDAK